MEARRTPVSRKGSGANSVVSLQPASTLTERALDVAVAKWGGLLFEDATQHTLEQVGESLDLFRVSTGKLRVTVPLSKVTAVLLDDVPDTPSAVVLQWTGGPRVRLLFASTARALSWAELAWQWVSFVRQVPMSQVSARPASSPLRSSSFSSSPTPDLAGWGLRCVSGSWERVFLRVSSNDDTLFLFRSDSALAQPLAFVETAIIAGTDLLDPLPFEDGKLFPVKLELRGSTWRLIAFDSRVEAIRWAKALEPQRFMDKIQRTLRAPKSVARHFVSRSAANSLQDDASQEDSDDRPPRAPDSDAEPSRVPQSLPNMTSFGHLAAQHDDDDDLDAEDGVDRFELSYASATMGSGADDLFQDTYSTSVQLEVPVHSVLFETHEGAQPVSMEVSSDGSIDPVMQLRVCLSMFDSGDVGESTASQRADEVTLSMLRVLFVLLLILSIGSAKCF